jgi:hypothetical protein
MKRAMIFVTMVFLGFAPASYAVVVGPGPYGYTITDEVPLVWEEISGTGTRILVNVDDSHVYVPNMGFAFPFMAGSFSDVSISSNGSLSLGQDAYLGLDNRPIPGPTGYSVDSNFIAVFQDDLMTTRDAVYYETRGAPGDRRLIVQWNLVNGYSSTPETATFSATLYEATGNIALQYPDAYFGSSSYNYGVSATVGIQEDPTSGLQWSYNQSVILNGTDLLISRTVVPEPLTLLGLVSGLGAIGAYIRRKR